MKTRGVAVMVAVLLAIGATWAMFLYVQGVRSRAEEPPKMVSVVVPKQDISAGTVLDDLISENAFTSITVPENAIVEGAITDLAQLEQTTAAYPILAGEQISTLRLEGFEEKPPGGVLGIPGGMKAVTIPLDLPRAVGGVVQRGDHVTVYATFSEISLLPGSLEQILTSETAPEAKNRELGSLSITVVPDVELLKVETAESTGGGSSSESLNRTVLLTMALSPKDAQNVVFAQERGLMWVALLPPNEEGTEEPPVSFVDVLLERLA
jgi:pilus assembly protein CpaB